MLSVQRVVYALGLLVFASSVTATTECASWRQKTSTSAVSSTVQLMTDQTDKLNTMRLAKRLNSGSTTPIRSGLGACGSKYADSDLAVLLWNGNKEKPDAGWGSGTNKVNCGKQVYIQYNGKTVYANVVDFGTMNIDAGSLTNIHSLDKGCSTLWATKKVFEDLGASTGSSIVVTWDYEKSQRNQPAALLTK